MFPVFSLQVAIYANLPLRNSNRPPTHKQARTATWVAMTDGLYTDQDHGGAHQPPSLAALDELQLYLQAGLEPLGIDIVKWWDVHIRAPFTAFRAGLTFHSS